MGGLFMFTYESTQFDIEGFILVMNDKLNGCNHNTFAIHAGDISFSHNWYTLDLSPVVTTETRTWYDL